MSKTDLNTLNKAIINLARKDSSIFTQYIFGYKNAPFHNMWHKWLDTHNHGLLLSYRGSGKCLAWNTNIYIKRNTGWKNIYAKNVCVGDEIYGWDEINKIPVITKITDVFDNGIQPIYLIKTKQNTNLLVSYNHPFLTDKGWKEAQYILKGDLIKKISSFNKNGNIDIKPCFYDQIEYCDNIYLDKSIGITTEHHTLIIEDIITHNSEQIMGRVLWEIGNNQNIRIKLVTESIELSRSLLSKISTTIKQNELFKQVFPEIEPDPTGEWSATKIRVKRTKASKDATVEAAGVLTSKTGGRSDLIFFDDVSGIRSSILQPKLRAQIADTIFSNWFPMLDGPEARWYCIGTPWHVEDIVSQFRNNPDIPKSPEVKVGPNFESPWPERHSSEYFKELLKKYGRISFNRGYRLVAISANETWINKDIVLAQRDFDIKLSDIATNKDITKFMGVDLGHRTGRDNCPTVVFSFGILENGKKVPCDIRISHDASPLNISRLIINTAKEINPCIIFVENVGAQNYLVDILKTLGPGEYNIQGYFTNNQKMDLRTGVPSLLAEIEAGKWMFPFGDGGNHDITCTCVMCKWIGEMCDFPNGTSDVLMASYLALQAYRFIRGDSGKGNFSIWSWEN